MGVYLKRYVLWRWRRSESGQDLLEYALLVSLIVLAAVAAINTLGITLKTVFWDVIAAAKF
jgi:Flp pilus assembly pilin Flp